jgi:hypothetical protein
MSDVNEDQPRQLSRADALAAYSRNKAAAKAEGVELNSSQNGVDKNAPVSDAARIMGKRAAEARAARQAQQPQNQEGSEDDDEANPQGSHGETADTAPDPEAQPEADNQSGDGEIDLGDGTKVTRDEVREGFLRTADYTRKTMALAEERKSWDNWFKQTGELTNALLEGLTRDLQPKDELTLIQEYGYENGRVEFLKQQKKVDQIRAAMQARQQMEAETAKRTRQSTIQALAQTYGEKAQTHYEAASKYAAQRLNMDETAIMPFLSPENIEILHDARQWRELQASKGNVTRFVADKPKVTKPGVRTTQTAAQSSAINNGFAKLKQSGNPADAVALWRAMKAKR